MDKLVEYLDKSGINYKRIKETHIMTFPDGIDRDIGRNQVVVYDDEDCLKWDAICHYGSYGYEAGLLEIMGDIVDEGEDGDSVAGWLTADDVIKRIKAQEVRQAVCELRQKTWSEKDFSEGHLLIEEITKNEGGEK